jgi:hypothetical protein
MARYIVQDIDGVLKYALSKQKQYTATENKLNVGQLKSHIFYDKMCFYCGLFYQFFYFYCECKICSYDVTWRQQRGYYTITGYSVRDFVDIS